VRCETATLSVGLFVFFPYDLCLLGHSLCATLLQSSLLGLLLGNHGFRVDGAAAIDAHECCLDLLQAHHFALLLTRHLHGCLTTGSSQKLGLNLFQARLVVAKSSVAREKGTDTKDWILDYFFIIVNND